MSMRLCDLSFLILRAMVLTLFVVAPTGFSSAADKETIPQGGTVTTGNSIYQVYVQDIPDSGVGLYTATTGPSHPAGNGLNVLYGNGNPGTTFNTIHSYTTGTDYTQNPIAASVNPIVDLDPFGLVTLLGTTGVRTTYVLPGPPATPDTLTIIQDVNVHGTTFADSMIEVTTTVVNNGANPVQMVYGNDSPENGPHVMLAKNPA